MAKRKFRRRIPDDPEDFRATLVEHLNELRDRVMRALGFLIIGWIAGWFLEPPLYAFLNHMVVKAASGKLPANVHYIEAFKNLTEAFVLKLQLSFVIGLVIAFPFIIIQLWRFIEPGLKASERKPLTRVAPISLILFCTGAGFCWFILPYAIGWFTTYISDFPGTTIIQEPGTMVFFCLKMLLAFGVGFQVPLVVYILGAIGLLSAETLFKYWRQGAVAIFVLAAVVTPSNDAFSMLMMAVPLTLLFILSIFVVKRTQDRKKKHAKLMDESEPEDDHEPEPHEPEIAEL